MLVGNSKLDLILVRAAAFLFSYLSLLCVGYFVVAALIGGVAGIANPFSIFVEVVGIIEILWYLVWSRLLQRRLEEQGPSPPALPSAERSRLFIQEIENVPDLEEYVRGWFGKAHIEDIRRDNLKDWLLWFLFGCDGPAGMGDEELGELEECIEELEERLGFAFKPGRGDAKPLRLGFDPIKMSHRSLFYYAVSARWPAAPPLTKGPC